MLVVALVESGLHGAWAERVVESGSLHAPELVLAEATNILHRLERAGLLITGEANSAQHELSRLNIELYSLETFAESIWQMRHNVTIYEAWYVATAEALGLPQ